MSAIVRKRLLGAGSLRRWSKCLPVARREASRRRPVNKNNWDVCEHTSGKREIRVSRSSGLPTLFDKSVLESD
eukprot:3035848-Pyramimonas_sp.AAC.1